MNVYSYGIRMAYHDSDPKGAMLSRTDHMARLLHIEQTLHQIPVRSELHGCAVERVRDRRRVSALCLNKPVDHNHMAQVLGFSLGFGFRA